MGKEDSGYVPLITIKMFVPMTMLEWEIECSLLRQTVDYYYTKQQLIEEEGEHVPCLEVPVELFDHLFAN